MSLTVLLMTALSYFYQQVSWLNTETDRIQHENFQLRYLENRLSMALPRAVGERDKKGDCLFFTSPPIPSLTKEGIPNLVFTFDNGIILDTSLSNHVLARLYIDPQSRLCLATWPSPKRWEINNPLPKMTREILMENVSDLTFEFFVAPHKERKNVFTKGSKKDAHTPTTMTTFGFEEAGWVTDWKQEYEQLPAIVKMTLTRQINKKSVSTTFAFPLPNSDKIILYN